MTEKIARIQRPLSWRQEFIRQHDYRCHYCNRPGGPQVGPDGRPWHVDHRDALADGGKDVEENLTLACKRCNIAKSDRPYADFVAYARIAFWNEIPEQIPEAEIDALLEAWRVTPQGAWSYRTTKRDGREPYVVSCRPAGEVSNRKDKRIAAIDEGYGRYPWGRDVAEFLIRAQRVVPLLVAELRLLRTEKAETSADSPATTDVA